MIEEVTTIEAMIGTGGVACVFMLIKFFAKQGFGGLLDVREMGARNDILADLRADIDRLKQEAKEDRERIDMLEGKVERLKDRLVTIRGHALVAYSIVQTTCSNCPQVARLLDAITEIIKED